MISETQEEQACSYVLGLLSDAECAVFEKEIKQNITLSMLVASLNNVTISLARSVPKTELPVEAKQRLLAAISQLNQQTVRFDKHRSFGFLPWAIAACLVAILYSQWNISQRNEERLQISLSQRESELKITQKELAEVEIASITAQRQLADQLAVSDSVRAELLSRVTALEKKDFIAQAKIAVMSSKLKDRPQAVAVSLWDQEKQNGLLVVENLPILDAGKDYQLWVIDPGIAAPVSAGVFKVDADGKVRITFKPNQSVPAATTFAVTEEKAGGVLSPTMDKMVVIGGI